VYRLKLLTFKIEKEKRLGAYVDGKIVDLNLAYARYLAEEKSELNALFEATKTVPPKMLPFIENGDEAIQAAKKAIEYVSNLGSEESDLKKEGIIKDYSEELLDAPIPKPRKNIICLGLNYAEHVAEGAQARGEEPPPLPENPIFFTKPTTSVNGPFDPIVYPKATQMLDYEVEFAFIIGKKGKYIPLNEVYDHVFGYTVFNDVTARDLQRRHLQWFKGKGLDTFAPMGPWIVTRDELGDPNNLEISLKVNGEQRQHSNTRHLIFSIPVIVETLSAGITLEPGDIIATGTPSGVGASMKPPGLLKVGDLVEAEIEKIGLIRNKVISEK